MKFKNGRFAKAYTWVTRSKEAMGLLFSAFIIVYLFLGLFAQEGFREMDIFTAYEMAFASFFVGVLRQAIIPAGLLSKTRAALWIGLSTAITLGFSLVFDWFEGFPLWCRLFFWGFALLGFAAMILAYYFELHQETMLLNRRLEQFQSGKNAERA